MALRSRHQSIAVRNLDPGLKERLRIRGAKHGHSMEAEVRRILRQVPDKPAQGHGLDVYSRIRSRFEALGGADIERPPREPVREPPVFE